MEFNSVKETFELTEDDSNTDERSVKLTSICFVTLAIGVVVVLLLEVVVPTVDHIFDCLGN